MKISENYNNAKQKYGETIARKALELGIPEQFVFAACRFNIEDGVPLQELCNLFVQWKSYVVANTKNIDVNNIDYNTFRNTLVEFKKKVLSKGEIYNDGTISIKEINSYEDMKNMSFSNLWCIRKSKKWDEYKSKEPPAVFYLVTNNHYSEDSNCKYVMLEMYPDEIGYWSTDNELIDEEGSSRRLPKLSEYQDTLGNALQTINNLQNKLSQQNAEQKPLEVNSRQYPKTLIRLTEQDLYDIIRESVRKITKKLQSESVFLGFA